MGLTLPAGSLWWRRVFFLVFLHKTWVTSQESPPNHETYWVNVTTGYDQVYITSEETSGTSNTTLETYQGNVTTGPDQVYNISEETTRTPNTTLETHWDNFTTGPKQVNLTSEETSESSNTPLQTHWGNVTTGSEQVYLTIEKSTPNITVVTNWGNVTTGLDLSYTINEDTPRTPNTTLQTHSSHVTTDPNLVYITSTETPNITLETNMSNVTMRPDLTSVLVASRTPSSTLVTYTSNVTPRPDLSYIHEETSGTTNTTPVLHSNNVTSGSHLTYITEDTARTPNTTIQTYPSKVTATIDLVHISQEISTTPNTTGEGYPHNVTTGPDLAYISEETTRTPYSTLEVNKTSYTELMYTAHEEPMTGTPSTTLQSGGASSFSVMYCLQDADCPPLTTCADLGGDHHICHCHLGYYFHHDLGCVTARTFPARIPLSVLYWDEISVNISDHRNDEHGVRHSEVVRDQQVNHRVALLFQNVLSHIPGYLATAITEVQSDEDLVTIVHSFSTLYAVTEDDLWRALTVSPLLCTEPHLGCVSLLTSDNYQGLSLCDFDVCDSSSSDCHSHGGLVTCECRKGYYKFSPTDRSCRACRSGFIRTENGCERCPIGFGGFNCEESYLLVVIVESCVACVFLVSLITLLVFYFRRKEPQRPMFIDSIDLGLPTHQPSLRLPRAQFSWRREWEWNEPPEKVLTDIQREAVNPDRPAIPMKTFGDPARFSAPYTYHGRHNLSFISD